MRGPHRTSNLYRNDPGGLTLSVFPIPIGRRAVWQGLVFGAALAGLGSAIALTGWVTGPPFRNIVVNRVVFSLVALFGIYMVALNVARLTYAYRGLAGVSIDDVGFESGVSGIRYIVHPTDSISNVSGTGNHITVMTMAEKKIRVPVKVLDTDLSAGEIVEAIENELSDI